MYSETAKTEGQVLTGDNFLMQIIFLSGDQARSEDVGLIEGEDQPEKNYTELGERNHIIAVKARAGITAHFSPHTKKFSKNLPNVF